MSSPSRLANWSNTWSRSTSRMRWRTICLAVWAPIRPNTSPSSASRLDEVAGLRAGFELARIFDGDLGQLVFDLLDDQSRPEHADQPDSASMRTWMSSSPATPVGRLDAVLHRPDELLTRDLLFGVQLKEAPTKSRLTIASFSRTTKQRPVEKTWGSPTSRSGRSVMRSIYGCVDGSNRGREAPRDVVLEDVDELPRGPRRGQFGRGGRR